MDGGVRGMGVMRVAMVAGLALSGGLVGAGVARADDHPPLAASRDVTVDYSVTPQGAPKPMDVRVAFSGDGNLLRIDGAAGKFITILDRARQQVTLVSNPQRVFTQFSPRNGLRNPFLLSLSMKFTQAGQDVIAGVPCTKWNITSDRGAASACVTADGVILSENGVDGDGMQGQLMAKTVTYGPVASDQFVPPSGYERIQPHVRAPHDQGPGAGAMPPGGGGGGGGTGAMTPSGAPQ